MATKPARRHSAPRARRPETPAQQAARLERERRLQERRFVAMQDVTVVRQDGTVAPHQAIDDDETGQKAGRRPETKAQEAARHERERKLQAKQLREITDVVALEPDGTIAPEQAVSTVTVDENGTFRLDTEGVSIFD